jgi:RNA polymerase sigma factor (sigma-70 family)
VVEEQDRTTLFEAHRDHLRAVAHRMLGSSHEADDAVQQAWLRASTADLDAVGNVGGWLTTVTSRVCLDALRSRRRRAEQPLTVGADVMTHAGGGVGGEHGGALAVRAADPAAAAERAEAVGEAMLVVLDRLSPAERVAFVLHDLFSVSFDEIAAVVGRSTVATKKLASRARGRVRGTPHPSVAADLAAHRAVVEAFRRAAAGGDVDALLGLLAPDVVRRVEPGPPGRAREIRGAQAVAEDTRRFGGGAGDGEVVLVDGRPGIVIATAGRLRVAVRITIAHGLITSYEVLTGPAALAGVDVVLC